MSEFEEWLKANYPSVAEGHSYQNGWEVPAMRKAWDAGIASYLEAQKPECEIYTILLTGSCYEWCVTTTTEGFATEQEAKEWAKANGYRIAGVKTR